MAFDVSSADSGLLSLLRSIAAVSARAGVLNIHAIYVPQVGFAAGDVVIAGLEEGRFAVTKVDMDVNDFVQHLSVYHPVPSAAELRHFSVRGRFGGIIGVVRLAVKKFHPELEKHVEEQVQFFADHVAFEKTSGVFDAISRQSGFISDFKSLESISETVCSVLTNALYCQAAVGWKVSKGALKSFGDAEFSMSSRDGLAGLAAERGHTIVAHDITNSESNIANFDRDIRHRQAIVTMKVNDAIFIPVLRETRTVAVFGIYFKRKGGATVLDKELSEYIVGHYASYFRLYDEIARLQGVEDRLKEKGPYINSVMSVLSDMHDLQNHIRGIENALLLRNESQNTRISKALEATNDALALLKHRRDWMTLPSGKSAEASVVTPDRQLTRIVLRDLVDSVIQIFEAETSNTRIEVVNLVDPAVRIRGYFAALQRAIQNLVSNSVKILSIRSGPKKITIGSRSVGNGGVDIFVDDNGGGVLEKDEPHMFELLYSSWGQAGMGLGLTIVASAAELHGGVLKHTNRTGSGVEFRIELPSQAVIQR